MVEATRLQLFAEKVAADVVGVSHPEMRQCVEAGAGIVGIDPITIMALIEMIMTMISQIMENCPQNDAGLRDAIKNPSLWQKVRVNRAVRDNTDGFGLRWRKKSNRISQAMMAAAAVEDDETIDAVVDQIRNSSW